MQKLSVEEVKHTAHLARICLTDEEIEKYRVSLAKLYEKIDEINEVEEESEALLISPVEVVSLLREDEIGDMISHEEVFKNVPRKNGKFVEVPVVINE